MTIKRIFINGVPGSGKSTVANILATRLGLNHLPEDFEHNPHIGTDAVVEACNYQADTVISQMRQNPEGVFEQHPEVAKYIFTPNPTLPDLKWVQATNDVLLINLVVPLDIIQKRIVTRNRLGYVKTELTLAEVWYNRYIDNLPTLPGIPVSALASQEKVAETIHNLLIKIQSN